jgi:hypothetical protein
MARRWWMVTMFSYRHVAPNASRAISPTESRCIWLVRRPTVARRHSLRESSRWISVEIERYIVIRRHAFYILVAGKAKKVALTRKKGFVRSLKE